MQDQSSRFLDQIQERARIQDRGRALSGVRAVFYALFRPLDAETASDLARLLPAGLESLWKPAYFQFLRDSDAAHDDPADPEEALRRIRQRTPTVDRQEAERLAGAVASALSTAVGDDSWSRLGPRLPGDDTATAREPDDR